jgi:aspartyl/glutamyl-tRNA(Asn/Gln) amidotransferase C subunit
MTPRPASGVEATAREVALLARLELAPDEEARLGLELSRILEAFQTLGGAEVDGVAPLVAPITEGAGGLRPDVPSRGLAREELLARAPDAAGAAGESGASGASADPAAGTAGGERVYFRVPRAIPATAPGTDSERAP